MSDPIADRNRAAGACGRLSQRLGANHPQTIAARREIEVAKARVQIAKVRQAGLTPEQRRLLRQEIDAA